MVLCAFAAYWAILLVFWNAWASALGHPPSDFVSGFGIGIAVASVPWMLWVVVTSVDGSASWREGAEGEAMTAKALRRLGSEWQVEHDIPFVWEHGTGKVDVDHVAVGPYGVLVVETKSTTKAVDLGSDPLLRFVVAAARQAEANAGRVRAVLAPFPTAPVIPVVVYWGRLVVPVPDLIVRRVGEARVVRGADAKHWAAQMAGLQRVDNATQAEVMARLRAVADRTRARHP